MGIFNLFRKKPDIQKLNSKNVELQSKILAYINFFNEVNVSKLCTHPDVPDRIKIEVEAVLYSIDLNYSRLTFFLEKDRVNLYLYAEVIKTTEFYLGEYEKFANIVMSSMEDNEGGEK